MNINTGLLENDTDALKKNISMVIKLNIIKNAAKKGWRVEKKDGNTFILKKSLNIMRSDEKNTDKLIDGLLNVENFDSFDKSICEKNSVY
jgi:hypothetical protein